MDLEDFLRQNRDEMLARSVTKLMAENPSYEQAELQVNLGAFLDEVVDALGRDRGMPQAPPATDRSEAAAQSGTQVRRHGLPIAAVSRHFGVLSDTLGELGALHGESFGPRDYQVFDACLDSAIAAALERYSVEEQRDEQSAATQQIGVLAHELRNALAGAQMSYSVLHAGHLGVRSRTGAILERSLKRMELLVNHALSAVLRETGADPDFGIIDLGSLLRDVVSLTSPQRGIALHLDAKQLPKIEGNERLLTSAISNLVQNAVKFTRDGGQVWIRARSEADSITIEVEDECGGLPPGKHDELFAPFVQRGSNRSGLGLGLAIVLDAVNAHDGNIEVRDLPGKGCIFTIELPRPTSPRMPPAPVPPASS